MKILAIRGRNLASLAGDFALALDEEPLASAGLFAITGPTGSGKTTLLDALCLALFDRTPRLMGRSAVQVGRVDGERLGAADPRALLTRGAGAGFAEVDFLGRDGQAYTARWSVHRARGRPEGALQDSRLTLTRRGTHDVVAGGAAGGRRDTRAAIAERLGLDFEQFRRSALLAQGEFAAFLGAQPGDRSALLERITGSDVYARLSVAAHERRREATGAVDAIQQQLDALGVLSAEERAALEEELAGQATAAAQAQRALTDLERDAAWFAELDARSHALAEGQARVDQARARLSEADGRREALGRAERAERLRAPWERWQRATVEQARAVAGAANAQAAALAATTATASLAAAEAATRDVAAAAKQALDQADAPLAAARAADQVLAAARAVLEGAQAAQQRTASAAAEARALRASLETQEREARTAASAAARWLEEHVWLEPVATSWAPVDAQLQDLAQWSAEVARLGRAAEAIEDDLPALRAQSAGAAAAAEAARSGLARIDGEVAEAERAAAEMSRDELVTEAREADEARELARRARSAWQAAAVARGTAAAAEAEGERGRADLALATEVQSRTAATIERTAIELAEARRAHALVRDTFTLSDHRRQLRDHTPCPLCGSEDHPWAGASPDQDFEPLAARVSELDERLAQARQEHAAAAARRADAAERVSRAQLAAKEAAGALAEATEGWRACREQAGGAIPADASSAAALAAAEGLVREAAERLAEAQAAEEELTRRERAAATARDRREEARRAVEGAGREEATAGSALQARREALQAARGQHRAASERADAVRGALAGLLAHVPGAAQGLDDPATLRDRLAEMVVRRGDEVTRRDEGAAVLAGLVDRLNASRVEVERRSAEAASAGEALVLAEDRHARCQAARLQLLGGEAADSVERALRATVREAEAAHHAARDRLTAALAEAERAQTRRVEREQVAAEATGEAVEARLSLDAALDREGLDEELIRTHCERDAAWMDAERGALTELARDLDRASGALSERGTRLATHEADGRPERPRDVIEPALPGARAEVEATERRRRDLELALRGDEAAQTRAEELLAVRRRGSEQARVWQQLDALIGSASGEKFRAFAQSLTLEALLLQANAHLGDLAPRYRLERVPGEDLALQVVDRDFGDEVRSVNSLSGGETFLASLALALGLASLTAVDTPVESLFIDEGLGTLDPETLDAALSALDALQSGGRQIGIISHVESLSDHVAANVRVVRRGSGRSRLAVGRSA